jgi:hypothetical protein
MSFLKIWWPDATLFYFISFSFIHTIHSHILTFMTIRRGSSPFLHRCDEYKCLVMVRRGSVVMVRRGSVGWCGVAQLVARRLAGRQARDRFPARHHREVFPTEPQAMRRWREASVNVLYECDWMIVLYECYKNIKINKKSGILPPNLYKCLVSI